jgi:putative tryptophan/tyrosine transport system substrate-binding protein
MTVTIGRRELLATLGGAAAAWPLAARAQQPAKTARIGFLGADTQSGIESRLERFRAGLRDLGYVEGENIFIDFRWAEGNYARLAEFAGELVRLKVDLLATYGTPGTLAAKQATTTVPIVMIVSGDAVATGIVASLARPGGNVTGSTFFGPELNAKGFELLKDAFPSASRVGILLNPSNPVNAPILQAMVLTANALNLEVQPFEARTTDELQSVFSKIIKASLDAVAITDDTLFVANARRIAEIMANNRLPSVGFVDFAQAGGLIGYGVNFPDLWYRAAFFVDRILKGAKPTDLPVQQPTKFELVINQKTAKALGIIIPPHLLARADEVIE